MAAMMLGICGLSVESLQECLDGKRVEPNPPNLGPYTTDIDAKASPVDFEDLLTLVLLGRGFFALTDPAQLLSSRSRDERRSCAMTRFSGPAPGAQCNFFLQQMAWSFL